jgi:DegV family protein with EDD domain
VPRSFGVVTDSTADVPAEWRERFGIQVVPLTVSFGDESFKDGVDLSGDEFFERLRRARELPKTAAPSPGDFAAVYERLSYDCDSAVSIHIGRALSATAESARVGAESVTGFPVHVVDSGSLSMTLAFLCQRAAEAESLEAAISAVDARVERLRILALLDTLRYVEMGGRVSRAQAMVGNLLDVKPILALTSGAITSVDRVRTRSRAIPRLVEHLRRDTPVESLAVMHAACEEDGLELRERLLHEMPEIGEIAVAQIGPVLGTHAGPGAVGFAYVTA